MKTKYFYNRISIIASLLVACSAFLFLMGCKSDKNTQSKEETIKENGKEAEGGEPKIKLTVYASIQADKSTVYCLSGEGICTLNVHTKTMSEPIIPNEKIEYFTVSPNGKYIVYYADGQIEAYNLETQSNISSANAGKSAFSVFNRWVDVNKLIYSYIKSEDDYDFYLYTIDSDGRTSTTQAIELNEAAMYLNSSISGDLNTLVYQDEKGRVFYKNSATGMEEMLFIEQYPYDVAVSYDGKLVAYSKTYPTSTYIYNLEDGSNIRVSEMTGENIQFNPFDNNLISFIDMGAEGDGLHFILLNTQTKEAQSFQTEYIAWIDAKHFLVNRMYEEMAIFNIEGDISLPYQLDVNEIQTVVNKPNK